MNKKPIGKRLKTLRSNKKLTQQKVADLCCINRSTYCSYENSPICPPQNILAALASLYNVSLEYINCMSDDPSPMNRVLNLDLSYTDVPLIALDDSSFIRNIKTPKERVLQGNHIYCYSPTSFEDARIQKHDLLLVRQSPGFIGDTLLVKQKDSSYLIGILYLDNDKQVLYNYKSTKKFALLDETYYILGVIKEVVIRLK